MGIRSALSNATRWLFKRDTHQPDIIVKGIDLMSTFKERGERMDALVNQIKEAAARRDQNAQAAVDAEAERLRYEGELVQEEQGQNANYEQIVQFIASLAPLPRLVTDTAAAIAEKAARAAEEARLAEEAEAARVAAEQQAAQEAAAAVPEVPAPDAPAEAETPPDAAPEPQTEPVAEAAPDPFNIQPRE